MNESILILAVLCLCVVAAEVAARRGVARHAGTALTVIVLTAAIANLGVIPAGSPHHRPVEVYEAVFTHVAPLSIFWLMLGVNLQAIVRAGLPILGLFLVGACGTALGVVSAMLVVNVAPFAEHQGAVAGMLAATYTGGSVNFNALALHYGVVRQTVLYGSTIVVDNVLTTVWMVATLALPRLLSRAGRPSRDFRASDPVAADSAVMDPLTLALVLGIGIAAHVVSQDVSAALARAGLHIPPVLALTVLALLLAQTPIGARLAGAKVVGMFAVHLFLAVIGAFCDVHALVGAGSIAVAVAAVASITIAVHGLVTFGAAILLKIDSELAAVASQANIGGAGTAVATARSLGRDDLVLPAVLIGALGNALGTFIGFIVAGRFH